MNMFYYDRKEDSEMSVENLKTLEKSGILNKKLLLEVFTAQIEKEFKE